MAPPVYRAAAARSARQGAAQGRAQRLEDGGRERRGRAAEEGAGALAGDGLLRGDEAQELDVLLGAPEGLEAQRGDRAGDPHGLPRVDHGGVLEAAPVAGLAEGE